MPGWQDRVLVSAPIPRDDGHLKRPVLDGRSLDTEAIREVFLGAREPHPAVKQIGEYLGRLLFPERVRKEFERQSADGAVRVLLEVKPRELRRLPWELARRADSIRPLFLTHGTPWSRISRTNADISRPEYWPLLRVLLIVGVDTEDSTQDTIGARTEIRDVQDELARCAGFVDVELLDRPSKDELRACYNRHRPHLLHFVGHGSAASGAGALVIRPKGDAATRTWDAEQSVVDLQDWISRLVLLNACREVELEPSFPADDDEALLEVEALAVG
jgi:hypothetical protein